MKQPSDQIVMTKPPERSPAEMLATPVQYLKGVGPQRGELLAKLGLKTVRDLLFNFPRDYQDLTDLRHVPELEEDVLVSVRGVVDETDLRSTGTGKSLLGVLVREGQFYLRALWFNMPYMRDRFRAGQTVLLSGKAKLNGGRWEMVHPRVQWIDPDEETPSGGLLPMYSLTEGLNQGQLRKIVQDALPLYIDLLDEVFPDEYLAVKELWPLRQALPAVHFPASTAELETVQRRFVYQDLFILQLALAIKRQAQQSHGNAPLLEGTAKIDARIRRLFPFELTEGQEQAIREISADMARSVPMNRLLHGDVGSGKTVVALYAMLLAVAHGHQAVLMAPTEVLARQHARTVGKFLVNSQVRFGLLTGGLSGSEHRQTVAKIAAGELDIVVGTHALVSGDVKFSKLGLAVIDEQHKFGVRQRAMLRQTVLDDRQVGNLPHVGQVSNLPAPPNDPHYLVMTATPIPRTITMTLFGDLDVTTLADMPPGRQPMHTYLAGEDRRSRWWDFLRKKLREGRQAYVIVPLVEDSPQREAASLQAMYEELTNGELEAFRLGLIHGRMTSEEKEAAMLDFHSGQTQVLLATSVVEVGVDVSNATLMTICDAEHFGLAQLHQLRGRIARGSYPGYCCLLANPQSEEAGERLNAFIATTDGFKLAETDMQLRGPGDLFGTRQHGLPPLRAADLLRDAAVATEARADALQLVAVDPGLRRTEHAKLRRMVLTRYGQVLNLGDVG